MCFSRQQEREDEKTARKIGVEAQKGGGRPTARMEEERGEFRKDRDEGPEGPRMKKGEVATRGHFVMFFLRSTDRDLYWAKKRGVDQAEERSEWS